MAPVGSGHSTGMRFRDDDHDNYPPINAATHVSVGIYDRNWPYQTSQSCKILSAVKRRHLDAKIAGITHAFGSEHPCAEAGAPFSAPMCCAEPQPSLDTIADMASERQGTYYIRDHHTDPD